jgi:hypothetical protein
MSRTPADVHVCLISRQIMPNLLPILADRPKHVYGVVSPEMPDQWQLMTGILREMGIGASEFAAPSAEDWLALQKIASELATTVEREQPGARISLNVTGGTKLMVIACMQAMNRIGAVPIYMDTPHDRIQEVLSTGSKAQTIGNLLTVENYLWAQRLEIRSSLSGRDSWRRAAQKRETLTADIAERFCDPSDRSLAKLWGQVKAAANLAVETKTLSQGLPEKLVPSEEHREYLRQLPHLKVADDKGPVTLHFETMSIAHYLKGGWVEEYAYNALRAARPHDFIVGAKVESFGPRSRQPKTGDVDSHRVNELDAVAVHRNRMLLIECKDVSAPRPHGPGGREKKEKVVDFFYKLNTLRDLSQGLFGTTLLLAAQPLGDAAVARAEQLEICLLAGRDMLRLPEFLEYWKRERRAPDWAAPWL